MCEAVSCTQAHAAASSCSARVSVVRLAAWTACLPQTDCLYCLPPAPRPQVSPGDSSLSLLPPWHIYQRTTALYLASKAARIVYSSKVRARAAC